MESSETISASPTAPATASANADLPDAVAPTIARCRVTRSPCCSPLLTALPGLLAGRGHNLVTTPSRDTVAHGRAGAVRHVRERTPTLVRHRSPALPGRE